MSDAEPGTCNGRPCMQCRELTCGCPMGGKKVCAKIFNGPKKAFNNDCLAKCNGYKIIVNYGDCHADSNEVAARRSLTGCSSSIRAVFGGGQSGASPTITTHNTIDYITIPTTGDAQDFGDLQAPTTQIFGCSNGHGGL